MSVMNSLAGQRFRGQGQFSEDMTAAAESERTARGPFAHRSWSSQTTGTEGAAALSELAASL